MAQKRINVFEQAAAQMDADGRSAFRGNPVSKHFRTLSTSTDTKVIGRVWPQTAYINTSIAHQLNHHELADMPIRFDRIELRKSSKLTDCISTAAISAHAFIISDKALMVFRRFDLGRHAVYPATIFHKDVVAQYHVLHFVNDAQDQLDCTRSKFHITDILGRPKGPIEIKSLKQLEDNARRVHEGEFPGTKKYDFVRMTVGYFVRGFSTPDVFTIKFAGTDIYISIRLAEAIESEGLTGFTIDEVLDIADPGE